MAGTREAVLEYLITVPVHCWIETALVLFILYVLTCKRAYNPLKRYVHSFGCGAPVQNSVSWVFPTVSWRRGQPLLPPCNPFLCPASASMMRTPQSSNVHANSIAVLSFLCSTLPVGTAHGTPMS
jgi:hypothetical protein